ncbi:hypothetical protein NDN08_001786 [Rhodosorus marinus]|uniref:GRIP domain-containing protein n=1 Tax=Rhodosorus marinus TaxID=101924 RepID=A0AAV8URY6_9RHOD|nr:hypothetical protein NDN08_001786 [Rhodosorus marinus]
MSGRNVTAGSSESGSRKGLFLGASGADLEGQQQTRGRFGLGRKSDSREALTEQLRAALVENKDLKVRLRTDALERDQLEVNKKQVASENARMRQERERLSRSLADFRKRFDTISDENFALRRKVQAETQHRARLQEDLEDLQKKQGRQAGSRPQSEEQAQKANHLSRHKLDTYEVKSKALEDRLSRTEKTVDQYKAEIVTLKQKVLLQQKSSAKEILELQEALSKTEEENQNFQNLTKQEVGKAVTLQAELAKISKRSDLFEAKCREQSAMLVNSSQKYSELSEKYNDLDRTNAKLYEEHKLLKARTTAEMREIDTKAQTNLETSRREVEERLAEVEKIKAKRQEGYVLLQNEYKTLENELNESNRKNAETIESLQRERDEYKRKYEGADISFSSASELESTPSTKRSTVATTTSTPNLTSDGDSQQLAAMAAASSRDVKAAKAKFHKILKKMEKEKNDALEESSVLRTEISLTKSELLSKETQSTSHAKQIDNLSSQLEQAEEERRRLVRQLETVKDNLRAFKVEKAAARAALDAKERDLVYTVAERDRLMKDYDAMAKQWKSKSDLEHSLEKEAAEWRMEHEKAAADRDNLSEKVSDLEETLLSMQETNETSLQQLREMEQAYSMVMVKHDDMASELRLRGENLVELQEEVRIVREECNAEKEKGRTYREELDSATLDRDGKIEENERLGDEIARLSEDVARETGVSGSLAEEKEALLIQFDTMRHSLESKVEELSGSLDEAKKALAEQRMVAVDLNARGRELEEEKLALSQEFKVISDQHEEQKTVLVAKLDDLTADSELKMTEIRKERDSAAVQLEQSKSESSQKLQIVSKELEGLRGQLAGLALSLKQQKESHGEEIQNLKSKHEEEKAQMKKELEASTRTFDEEKVAVLGQLRMASTDFESEKSQLKEQLLLVTADFEKSKSEWSSLEMNYERQTTQLKDALAKESGDHERERAEFADNLHASSELVEKERGEFAEQLAQLKQHHEHEKSDLSRRLQDVTNLYEQEKEQTARRIDEVTLDLTAKTVEAEELVRATEDLGSQNKALTDSLEQTSAELNLEINELRTEVERVSKEREMLEAKLEEHRQAMEVASEKVIVTTAGLEALRTQAQDKEESLLLSNQNLEKENRGLVQDIEASREREIQLQKSLEQVSGDLDVTKDNLKQQTTALTLECEALAGDKIALQSDLVSLDNQVRELEAVSVAQLKSSELEADKLNTALASAETENTSLKEKLVELEGRLGVLDRDLVQEREILRSSAETHASSIREKEQSHRVASEEHATALALVTAQVHEYEKELHDEKESTKYLQEQLGVTEKSLTQAKDEVSILTENLKQAERRSAEEFEKMEDAAAKGQALETKLQQSREANAEKQAENDKLRSELLLISTKSTEGDELLEQLNHRVAQSEEQNVRLKAKIDQLAIERESSEEEQRMTAIERDRAKTLADKKDQDIKELERQIVALSTANLSLEGEEEKIRLELSSAMEKIAALEKERTSEISEREAIEKGAEVDRNAHADEVAILKGQIDELNEERNSLTRAAAARDEQVQSLLLEKQTLEQRIASLSSEIEDQQQSAEAAFKNLEAASQAAAKTANEELEKERKELQVLSAQLAVSEEGAASVGDQLARVQAEVKSSALSVKKLEDELSAARDEREDVQETLSRDLAEASEELVKAKDQLRMNIEDLNSANQAATIMQTELEEEKSRFRAVSEELSINKQKLSEVSQLLLIAKQQGEGDHEALTELENQLKNVREQVAVSRKELEESSQELAQSQALYNESSQQLSACRVELKTTLDDLTQDRSQLQTAVMELEQSRGTAAGLSDELELSQKQVEDLREELGTSAELLNKTNAEMSSRTLQATQLAELLNDSEKQLSYVSEELAATKLKLSELGGDLEESRKESETKSAEVAAAKRETGDIAEELAEKETQYTAAFEELTLLKTQLENTLCELQSEKLELSTTAEELSLSRKEVETLSIHLVASRNTAEGLSVQLSGAQEELEGARKMLAVKEEELGLMGSDLESTRQKALEADRGASGQLKNLQSELEESQTEIMLLTKERDTAKLNASIEQDTLNEEIKELMEKNEGIEKVAAELRTQVSTGAAEVLTVKTALEDIEMDSRRRIDELTSKNNILEGQLTEAKKTSELLQDTMQKDFNDLEAKFVALGADLENEKGKAQALERERDVEKESRSVEATDYQKLVASLEAQMADAKVSAEDERMEFLRTRQDLESKLKALEEKENNLTAANMEMRESFEAKEKVRAEQRSALETRLNETEAETVSLRTELDEANTTIRNLKLETETETDKQHRALAKSEKEVARLTSETEEFRRAAGNMVPVTEIEVLQTQLSESQATEEVVRSQVASQKREIERLASEKNLLSQRLGLSVPVAELEAMKRTAEAALAEKEELLEQKRNLSQEMDEIQTERNELINELITTKVDLAKVHDDFLKHKGEKKKKSKK